MGNAESAGPAKGRAAAAQQGTARPDWRQKPNHTEARGREGSLMLSQVRPPPKCQARCSIESQVFPAAETGSYKIFLSPVRAARLPRGARGKVYGLGGCSQAGMGRLTLTSLQGRRVCRGHCDFAESQGEGGPLVGRSSRACTPHG